MESRFAGLWPVLRNAYGFDAFVMAVVVRPVMALCRWTYSFVDRSVIDQVVEGTGRATRRVGVWLASLQFGDAQWYAALLGAGAVLLMALALMGWK